MKKKNVTIDDLAVMVQGGFAETAKNFEDVYRRFDLVDKRFDKVEGRLIKLEIRMDSIEAEVEEIRKHQIAHTIYRDEFEKLENKVKALEKLLAKG